MTKKKTTKKVTTSKVLKRHDPRPVTKSAEGMPLDAINLINAAVEKGADVETLNKLLVMRKELKDEWAREQYVKAMAGFQSECPVIEKKKIVKDKSGAVRYKFADLASIIDQTKELIAGKDLTYRFKTIIRDTALVSQCHVTHINGWTEINEFLVPLGNEQYMSDVQKYGARRTFANRYSFCDAFGILTGDEDTDATPETVGTSAPQQPAAAAPTPATPSHKDILRQLCTKLEYPEEKIETQAKMKIDDMTLKVAESVIKQLTALLEKKQAQAPVQTPPPETSTEPKEAEILECTQACASHEGGICDCGSIPII